MKTFLSRAEINEIAEGLISDYFKDISPQPTSVDIEDFVEKYLSAPIVYADIVEEDRDRLAFVSDGKHKLKIAVNGVRKDAAIPKNTIVIDNYLNCPEQAGQKRFTIAHEGSHLIIDKVLDQPAGAHYRSEFDSERTYNIEEIRERMSTCEWQSNAMAAALLMPRFLVENALSRFTKRKVIPIYGETVLSLKSKSVIEGMAEILGVSYSALLIRLREFKMLEHHDISEYIAKVFNLRGDKR